MNRVEEYLNKTRENIYEGNEYGCIKGIVLDKLIQDIIKLYKQDMIDLLDDFVKELDNFSFDTNMFDWVIETQDLYAIQEQFVEKIGVDDYE